jgi:DNA-binding XRE family transcriptional regulator
MGTKFDDYIAKTEANATPEERELSEAFDAHYQAVYLAHFGIGQQLAAKRAEAHLSQSHLARVSGIPQPEISRIESGQGNPTRETLARLGAPLGLVLAYVSPDNPAVSLDSAAS